MDLFFVRWEVLREKIKQKYQTNRLKIGQKTCIGVITKYGRPGTPHT